MNYKLDIEFNPADVRELVELNQKVVIIKHTTTESNVAWIAFTPFERNRVEWEETFALYASQSQIQDGASIRMLAKKKVPDNQQYPFVDNVFGSGVNTTPPVGDGKYGLENQLNHWLTFGLAQGLTCNGMAVPSSPINAVVVPGGQSAVFEPIEKIAVFMQSNVDTGAILATIKSKCIVLVYEGNIQEQTIMFCNGEFKTC